MSVIPSASSLVAAADQPSDHAGEAPVLLSPLHLIRAHAGQLAFTYALFALEMTGTMILPLLLGNAINGLLHGRSAELILFAGMSLAKLAITASRQMYDTRVYLRIHGHMVASLAHRHRSRPFPASVLAAHAALGREIVDFFEHDVAAIVTTLATCVGSFVMLSLFDWRVTLLGAALVCVAVMLNRSHARNAARSHSRINDLGEREVETLARGSSDAVTEHHAAVSSLRIGLSDRCAMNMALMELFALALLVGSLALWRLQSRDSVGDVVAIVRYILLLAAGLNNVPVLVQQLARMRDNVRRLTHPLPR